MEAYDHTILDQSAKDIVDTAKRTEAIVHGPIPPATSRRAGRPGGSDPGAIRPAVGAGEKFPARPARGPPRGSRPRPRPGPSTDGPAAPDGHDTTDTDNDAGR